MARRYPSTRSSKAPLKDFYQNLLRASGCQSVLPDWVRLEATFQKSDLGGMPRIDGALLRKAINMFANNKSCADDGVVSEMLNVLHEDVLDMMAVAFETGF